MPIGIMIKVEPYWNVNNGITLQGYNETTIKVEPYWNVNDILERELFNNFTIKVEPYWNVNLQLYEKIDMFYLN